MYGSLPGPSACYLQTRASTRGPRHARSPGVGSGNLERGTLALARHYRKRRGGPPPLLTDLT